MIVILEQIDKLIEIEKKHQKTYADEMRNVLSWESKGAIRAYEETKKLLKGGPIVKLIERRALEPHICYSAEDDMWLVTFGAVQDEDEENPICGAAPILGDAIKNALLALEIGGKPPLPPDSLN